MIQQTVKFRSNNENVTVEVTIYCKETAEDDDDAISTALDAIGEALEVVSVTTQYVMHY